jgi:hypothetical protein
MLKAIDPENLYRFTALIIGEAGIGKTSLIRTIPDNERVCCLSAESGLLAVRDLVASKKIEGFEIGSFADMREAYEMLASDQQMKNRYKWVFIDSLTEISSRCVEAMKAKYPNKADSFNLWGEYNDLMTILIKGFRDLQHYSVVFTCISVVEKDEINRRFYAPAVAGTQLQGRLTSFFDECLYMVTQKTEDGTEYRAFVTQPWERYPGKDRSGKLELIEKPDLAYVKSKILNGDVPF